MSNHNERRLGRCLSAFLVAMVATSGNAWAGCGDAEDRAAKCGKCKPGPTSIFSWALCGGAPPAEVGDEGDEEEALVTDRPDFTEASTTVGRGRVQVESGYTFILDNSAGTRVRTHSYPESLFRIGMLAEWFEFRIAYNFAEETTTDGTGTTRLTGSEDLYLGAKFKLTEQQGMLPEMVLLPQMTVPSGSAAFRADQVLPGVNWLYSWEITDVISLAGSTQFNRARDDVNHFYTEFAQSVSIGIGLTEKIGAYTEYFGLYPTGALEPGVGAEHYADGGFTYLLTNNIQFDVRAGVGLNERADNLFTGGGVSVRY